MSASTLEGLATRGFAGRSGFGKSPALVVVDYAKAFTASSHKLGSDSSKEIEATNSLISTFRKKALPIVFMTICYETQQEAENSNWRLKIDGVASLFRGNPDVEIDERLERTPEDPVLAKKYASSFFGTNLHELLQQKGVDTVVVAGCSTSGCVRATAVDACQYGYKAVVCREAVADRHKEAHDQALIDIDLKYGDVLSRSEITELIEIAGS